MIQVGSCLPDDSLVDSWPQVGDIITPDFAMRCCFELAKKGLGHVSPNPVVGCVIVDAEHRFLGGGYHERVGAAHAEQQILACLSPEELKDATVYVSLEPCAHHGKTPSCAKLLASLPIRKVLFAAEDPNPLVNGMGAAILNAAGIDCHLLAGYEQHVLEHNYLFMTRQRRQKQIAVGLKAGMTLDGKIAKPGDQRAWITGERARCFGHFLRLQYDAICVGAETLIQDNPTLNPRDTVYGHRVPWRIVVDPRLRALKHLGYERIQLFRQQSEKVIWIIDADQLQDPCVIDLETHGVGVIALKSEKGRFDPELLLTSLLTYNIHSLLLEGGAGLYSAFIERRLVDTYHLAIAPHHVYGEEGIPFFSGPAFDLLEGATTYIYPAGQDLLFNIHVSPPPRS